MNHHQWRLLITAVKNIGRRRLNRDLIGRHLTGTTSILNPTNFKAFAKATADTVYLRYWADTPRPAAPPLFIGQLVIPLLQQLVCLPGLGMDLLRVVHAEQHVKWYRPLTAGCKAELRLTIDNIEDTTAGQILWVTGHINQHGRLAVEGRTGLLVRRKKRRAGPGRPSVSPTAVQWRRELATAARQPGAYAAASGDRNPIHTRAWFARLAGLPGPIMHGNCVMAMAVSGCCDQLGIDNPARLTTVGGRFSRPAIAGRPLTLCGTGTPNGQDTGFFIQRSDGLTVLKNGYLTWI